ncbi:MAG: GMC oxidoreductase [Tenuifilaceae bacterium]
MANFSDKYDYIIIGSGFGGSVSALRLAEKGYKVAVIEKGKRFKPLDFAKTSWNLKKYLWLPAFGLYGIQALSWLKHVFILHGTGVGGGSLVYANNLLVPSDEIFRKKEWGNKNLSEILKPHYETAKRMMGAAKSPTVGKADTVLAEITKELTGKDTFHINNVGIFFGEKPDLTLPDPYFNGFGPERSTCTFCGACMVGCRQNAKNTLDKNYLFFAEKFGVEIISENEVVGIKKVDDEYEIAVKKVTGFFNTTKIIRTKGVVLSGGVMGSVKLLIKCKQKGWLPNISENIGNYVRTNAEALIGVMAKDLKVDYSDNTAITSGVYPDEFTHIEMVRYNKGSDLIGLLATVLVDGNSKVPRWMKLFQTIFRHPFTFIRTFTPRNFGARASILLVMQTVEGTYLKLTYSRKWYFLGKRRMDTKLPEGQKKITAFIPIANKIAKMMAERMDGIPMSLWTDAMFDIPTTAHILGGAIMANSPETGVVDYGGKVFGYENMYIADGSVIPVNLGVNPSLTILALSEYIMSNIPEKKGNTQNVLKDQMVKME